MVPELPRVDHTFDTEERDTQLASPSASEASTFHTQGAPPVILICPFTSSLAHGVVVPSPIFVPSS
jgi:hypothetical protein